MPGMDGLSAAREIAGERRAAVLILTAFSQRDLIEQARDAGALAYLVKPFQRASCCPPSRWRSAATAELRALERRGVVARGAARDPQARRSSQGQAHGRTGLTERDAFASSSEAMRERVTMKAVARQVLTGARPDP